jgi:hypothetical protein
MNEYLVMANGGDYVFGFDDLVREVADRWQGIFFPAAPNELSFSYGEIQLPSADGFALDMVLTAGERGIGIGSRDWHLAAEIIAWITTRPGFPGDGSVLLCNWAADFIPLRPGMTAEELLAAGA